MGRTLFAALILSTVTLSASAATERQQPTHPKLKPPAVTKTVKTILKTLGDWMSVPHP